MSYIDRPGLFASTALANYLPIPSSPKPLAIQLDLNGKPPAIAPGSLVLVTGVNGFIASHVADQLIQAGYRVKGTSRDTTKTQWIQELLDNRYGKGKFETVVVKDLAGEGAF